MLKWKHNCQGSRDNLYDDTSLASSSYNNYDIDGMLYSLNKFKLRSTLGLQV